MDDDRTLGGLADQPLDDVDDATLQQLRALYDATDPVPADLVERIHFSLALDEMFDEVATDDPGADRRDGHPRGPGHRHAHGDPHVLRRPAHRHGDGLPDRPGTAAARRVARAARLVPRPDPDPGGGEHEVLADDQGRFSFDRLDEGFGQLSFHPVGDDEPENAVVTPLFQL